MNELYSTLRNLKECNTDNSSSSKFYFMATLPGFSEGI